MKHIYIYIYIYIAFDILHAWLTQSSKNLFSRLKLFFSLPSGQSKTAMKRVSSNIEKGKLIIFTTQKYVIENSQIT